MLQTRIRKGRVKMEKNDNVARLNELKEIVDLLVENDLYMICDEVYEKYVYDGLTHISPASLEGMFERVITLNAMSKTFSATGFRLGYVAANKEIIDLMEKYHQYTVAGTNHAAQYGFLNVLKMDSTFFEPFFKSFDERRLFIHNRLTEMGFDVVKPSGAFYMMPSVEKFNIIGQEFSTKLMKEKAIAVVPGNIFGSFSDEKIRISYATGFDKLKEAMNRVEAFIKKL